MVRHSRITIRHTLCTLGNLPFFRRWALFDDLEYASQLLQPNRTGLGTNTNATGAPFYFLFFASFRNSHARTQSLRTSRIELLLEKRKKKKILAKISKNILLSLHFTIRSYHGPALITVHTVSVIILFRKYTPYRGKKIVQEKPTKQWTKNSIRMTIF